MGDNFHHQQPPYEQEEPNPPALVFDDYEPLPVDTISRDEVFPSTHNDTIRIPSMDSDFKWFPKDPTVPNMGHTKSIERDQLSVLEDLKCMTHQQQQSSPKKDFIPDDEITD